RVPGLAAPGLDPIEREVEPASRERQREREQDRRVAWIRAEERVGQEERERGAAREPGERARGFGIAYGRSRGARPRERAERRREQHEIALGEREPRLLRGVGKR